MIIFISGGCKNGKSSIAEKLTYELSKETGLLYYLATMKPSDDEDKSRIRRHIKDREKYNFNTIEVAENINTLKVDENGVYLLDSITALLSNEMFVNKTINLDANIKVKNDLDQVINKPRHIVMVSDYIYSDANTYDELTEKYRENLGDVDKYLASKSDIVLEVCSSNVFLFKGKELFESLGIDYVNI